MQPIVRAEQVEKRFGTIRTMECVASGRVSETALADWFRSHMTLHMCHD